MIKPVWIAGFSGHRPNEEAGRSIADLERCRDAIREALKRLRQEAQAAGGELHFYSSAAAGADIVAAEVASELELKVHLILPMDVEEFARDFEGHPEIFDRALDLIARAGGLTEVHPSKLQSVLEFGSRQPQPGVWPPSPVAGWTCRVARGSHQRNECYYECGEQMLEACDALVVIFNENASGSLGGTADVIAQAGAMSLPVVTIDPRDLSVSWGSQSPHMTTDEVIAKLTQIEQDKSIVGRKETEREFADSPVSRLFYRFNEVAIDAGEQFKKWVERAVLLHFFAALLATINYAFLVSHSGFDHAQWLGLKLKVLSKLLTGAEFVMVSYALFIVYRAQRGNLHAVWRRARFAAEILRSIIRTSGIIDPVYPLIGRHHPAWARFARSCGLDQRDAVPAVHTDWETVKQIYLKERIIDQRDHFDKSHQQSSRRAKQCRIVSMLAGYLAPPFIFLALVAKLSDFEWSHGDLGKAIIFGFLPIVLPLTAGVATSLRVVTDAARRNERYEIMVQRLDEVANWFPTLKTRSTIRRTVARTEEILLDELVEWYATNKDAAH